MSKINELIQTLCPDGVEYVELGNIVEFLNGRAYKQSELLDEGKHKVLRVGNFHTNGKWYYSNLELDKTKYCDNGDLLYTWAATLGPQIWNGGKAIYHYHIWKLIFDEKIISKRFLYHFLAMDTENISKSLTNSTMPHVSMANMKKRTIPVPPRPVQDEIVRILDEYTNLEAELEAKLSEEIELKQKQYEVYRDKLLTFGDDVEYKKLGEVGCVRMCKRIMKDQTSSTGDIPFYKIGTFGGTANAYITQELFDEYSSRYNYPKKGNVLISASGTIGRTVVFDGKPSYFQDSNIVWLEHDGTQVTDEYLKYIYSTSPWYVADGGTISRLYNDNILNAIIPVPSIPEQERIVKILDKYDTYTRDMISTLNTELESRKKQYAYYRDQLLTFKRKE